MAKSKVKYHPKSSTTHCNQTSTGKCFTPSTSQTQTILFIYMYIYMLSSSYPVAGSCKQSPEVVSNRRKLSTVEEDKVIVSLNRGFCESHGSRYVPYRTDSQHDSRFKYESKPAPIHQPSRYFSGSITIQNDKFGTRIFMNEDIEEANNLRRRLILRDGVSTSHSALSSQTVYPLRDEFLVKNDRKHVDEIRDIMEQTAFVVLGTIRMLEQEFGWFYKVCRKCQRKAVTKVEFLENSKVLPDNFIGAPIDSLWSSASPWQRIWSRVKFKVQFRVQDNTGSVSFVMFDKDVSKIVGLSASDIRVQQMKDGDMEAFLRELDVLTKKRLAFKIMVSEYNLINKYHVYTVLKYCDDPDVLGELGASETTKEVTEDQMEPSYVQLSVSSQAGVDSKDAFAVTGESLAIDVEMDSGTSPVGKRVTPLTADETNND